MSGFGQFLRIISEAPASLSRKQNPPPGAISAAAWQPGLQWALLPAPFLPAVNSHGPSFLRLAAGCYQEILMRYPRIAHFGLVLLFLAAGCTDRDLTTAAVHQSDALHAISDGAHDVIDGHYIVLLSRQPAIRSLQAEAELESITAEVGQRAGARVSHIYRHVLSGFAAELTDGQVEALRKDPRVLAIHPDVMVYPTLEDGIQENPPWGLDRVDQRTNDLDGLYTYSTTGKGVFAYIIDSGIRYSHNEFGDRALLGYDFVLEENPDNTDPTQGPGEDCRGHGTHVAGTVGGSTYGVAKDVKLVSVRIFGCTGGSPGSRTIAAVEWVTANASDFAVVNMSLGGSRSGLDMLIDAVENSIATGLHYAVSAGNGDTDACTRSPAAAPNALTVGAIEEGDSRAAFSNYGSCVDVYAPGALVQSAWHESDDDERFASGTSMSAPHVAGVTALHLENHPGATPAEVFQSVIQNASENVVSEVPSGTTDLLYSHLEPVDFESPPPPVLILEATGERRQGSNTVWLEWEPADALHVTITRNGEVIASGYRSYPTYYDNIGGGGPHATYVHQICEVLRPDHCSEPVTTIFGNGGGDDGGDPDPPPGDGPTASFEYSCGNSPTCQFTDSSTEGEATIVSRLWVTGSQTASGSQISFSFGTPGDHLVTLTVTDADDESDQTSKTITCRDHPRHGLRCS
jgi:subtilisin family serine protease